MKMILTFSSVFLISLSSLLHAQKAFQYHLIGTFPGIKKIYLYNDGLGSKPSDSIFLKDGKFKYSATTNAINLVWIQLIKKEGLESFEGGALQTKFYVEPGTIVLSFFNNDLQVSATGTPNNEILTKFSKANTDFTTAVASLYDSINMMGYRSFLLRKDTIAHNEDTLKALDKRITMYENLVYPWRLKFYHRLMNEMYAHPKSYFTASYLDGYKNTVPKDSVQEMYRNLGKDLQNSIAGKNIENYLKSSTIAVIGTNAPLFEDKEY